MASNFSDSNIAIEVEGLTKSFDGKVVVRDLTMRVRRGFIYGFLGPNGSGKTTTLRMLSGLLTPDRGRGKCLGFDILKDKRFIKERVGYMTQHFSLYHDLTIKENLEFVARIYGLKNPQKTARTSIEQLGLLERQNQLAGELSGGWKQRLALSACILPEPEVLLLDEPTAGVDPKARREFWNELHRLASEGLTVLVSTHYMDEAERCHEIAYIASGELLTHGSVEEVIANSGLETWTVSVSNPQVLALELQKCDGIDMVAPFGKSLHVSGRNTKLLQDAIAPYQNDKNMVWRRSTPSLEDVFIDLMRQQSVHTKDLAS